MMQQWRERLQSADPKLIAAGLLGIGFIALWLLVWQPLLTVKRTAYEAIEQKEKDLEWMHSAAQRIQSTAKPAPGGASQSRIDRIMKAQRIAVKRFDPGRDGRLRLTVEDADYLALLRAINSLQNGGLIVEELTLQRREQAGRVSANISLR